MRKVGRLGRQRKDMSPTLLRLFRPNPTFAARSSSSVVTRYHLVTRGDPDVKAGVTEFRLYWRALGISRQCRVVSFRG